MKDQQQPRPRLGKVSAAATATGLSEQTIRRYITNGKLTGYRLGPRMIRIDLDEVDALMHRVVSARD